MCIRDRPLPALTARTKKENLRRTVSLMNGCGRMESAEYRTATTPVSYTQLDVYKRQHFSQAGHAGTIEKTAGTGEAGNPLVY